METIQLAILENGVRAVGWICKYDKMWCLIKEITILAGVQVKMVVKVETPQTVSRL